MEDTMASRNSHVLKLKKIFEVSPNRIDPEVQAPIRHLANSEGKLKTDDPHVIQANVLWDKGIGRELGIDSFKDYLASIPGIPHSLLKNDAMHPLLRLVDPRLGLSKTCELFGIKFREFGYEDKDVISFDDRHGIPRTPFWVRAHDGKKHRECKPRDCRDKCTDKLFAMTAMVGVMVWVQDSNIIRKSEHFLDCPGSVHRLDRGFCAFLGIGNSGIRLSLGRYDGGHSPICGAGDFRRK